MECSKLYLKTVPGERVELEMTAPESQDCLVIGTVVRAEGGPAVGAAVLAMDSETQKPLGQCVTDDTGFFMLGPLPGGVVCTNLVGSGPVPVRTVEIRL